MKYETALRRMHILVEDEYDRERVEKKLIKLKNKYCIDRLVPLRK